jgi:hypothetical protein
MAAFMCLRVGCLAGGPAKLPSLPTNWMMLSSANLVLCSPAQQAVIQKRKDLKVIATSATLSVVAHP